MYLGNCVERDPKKWTVEEYRMKLTGEFGDEVLIKVDYSCVNAYMSIYMRQHIYENLLSGAYTLSPKGTKSLIILDEKGKIIEPLSKDLIY